MSNQVINKFLAFFLKERNVFLLIVILYVLTRGYIFIIEKRKEKDNLHINELYAEINSLEKLKFIDTLPPQQLTFVERRIDFLELSLQMSLQRQQKYLLSEMQTFNILKTLPDIMAVILFPVRWILMFLFKKKLEV